MRKTTGIIIAVIVSLAACGGPQESRWTVKVSKETTEDGKPCLKVLNYESNDDEFTTSLRDAQDGEPDYSGIYCQKSAVPATEKDLEDV